MVERKAVYGFAIIGSICCVGIGAGSYLPKLERMANYDKLISPAINALETKSLNDEKFLGADQPGFEELKKLMILESGYSKFPGHKIRGITQTKAIVFFCVDVDGEDAYVMVAPMLVVKEWIKKEAARQ